MQTPAASYKRCQIAVALYTFTLLLSPAHSIPSRAAVAVFCVLHVL